MNLFKLNASRIGAAVVAAALTFLPALASAARPDPLVTVDTKLELLASEIDASKINVDTNDGRVTLHGMVTSAEDQKRAEQLARSVNGVVEVKNLLQVVAKSDQKATELSDDKITAEAKRLIKADKSLERSSFSVDSVNKGVVLLSGKAASRSDQLRVMSLVRDIPGVKRVSSSITGPAVLADEELWRDETGKKTETASTMSDMRITAATKMRLIGTSDVPALDIDVDTTAGVVTLFGEVPTATSKTLAENEAKKVSGVVRVVNALQVVPKSKQDAVQAKDDVVEKNIKATLDGRDELKKVSYDVKNGVAHLTGTVPTVWDRLYASRLVRATTGVRAVVEEIKVDAKLAKSGS